MATRSPSLASWRRQAIRRIEAVRRSTLAFVATLPEDEILRPRTLDQWSVKDVLAHLMSCDEETVRRFRLIARGRGDRIFWFRSMADADRFAIPRTSTRSSAGCPSPAGTTSVVTWTRSRIGGARRGRADPRSVADRRRRRASDRIGASCP